MVTEEEKDRENIVIPYVAGLSQKPEKNSKNLPRAEGPSQFQTGQDIKTETGPPKDKTPRDKLSNVVYAFTCSEECSDLYIGQTKRSIDRWHNIIEPAQQDRTQQNTYISRGKDTFRDDKFHILD